MGSSNKPNKPNQKSTERKKFTANGEQWRMFSHNFLQTQFVRPRSLARSLAFWFVGFLLFLSPPLSFLLTLFFVEAGLLRSTMDEIEDENAFKAWLLAYTQRKSV